MDNNGSNSLRQSLLRCFWVDIKKWRREAAQSLQSDCSAPLAQDVLMSRRHLLPVLGEWSQVPLALEHDSTFVIAKDGRDFEINDTVPS